jgi:hypothetical protein
MTRWRYQRLRLRQIIFNIYSIGPVLITVLALAVAEATGNPSHTAPERYWIVYVGLAVVAIAVGWHLSLIITTGPPRWAMVLYMFINLPLLYFLTMFNAEIIAMGARYWEAPM